MREVIVWARLEIFPDVWEQLMEIAILSLQIYRPVFDEPYEWHIENSARLHYMLLFFFNIILINYMLEL